MSPEFEAPKALRAQKPLRPEALRDLTFAPRTQPLTPTPPRSFSGNILYQ